MWNRSHRTLSGKGQKISSYTTKAARQISMNPGRTENKIGSGRDWCPLGRICKGEKVHVGRPSTWEVPYPAGKSSGQMEGLEKPRLCSQGVCPCRAEGNWRLDTFPRSQEEKPLDWEMQPRVLHVSAWHEIRVEKPSTCRRTRAPEYDPGQTMETTVSSHMGVTE